MADYAGRWPWPRSVHGELVQGIAAQKPRAIVFDIMFFEPDIYRLLLDRRIHVVTFTSASAVRGFVNVLGREPAADLLRTTVVASIGPLTAQAAARCDIHTTILPSEYTVPALVDAIVEYFSTRP